MGTNSTTYLGIDGGGTRCRARIEDKNGRPLGESNSGPATTRIGVERTCRSIMEATEAAAAKAGLARADFARMHAAIGLAGLGRRGAEAALNKITHPFASVIFISDGMAACLGAHSGTDGAIVVTGTGSVGVGLIGGPRIPLAGYGFSGSGQSRRAPPGLRGPRRWRRPDRRSRNPAGGLRLSGLGRRQRRRHRPAGRAAGAAGGRSPRRAHALAFRGIGRIRSRSLSGGRLV